MPISTETKFLIGILLATIAIIIGGALLVGQKGTSDVESVADPVRLVRDTSPIFGPTDARVTVVEFGDFECPSCAALHPILQEVKAANKDASVRFVYRHFPLPQHPHAQSAAEASVEAQVQGKFWEYHDKLFANQTALDRPSLERYASELGLNLDAFKKALDDNTHRGRVLDDQADGRSLRVDSTPTVYINGIKFTGNFSASNLQAAIDEALRGSNQ